MLYKQTFPLATIAALAVTLVFGTPLQATASLATKAAADQAAVNSAVKEYVRAIEEATELQMKAEALSVKLDDALAVEKEARAILQNRAAAMYRVEDTDLLAAIFTSESFTDLMARWDLIMRIGEQDADNLSMLRTARAEAQKSAKSLITLQENQAKAVDALAEKVSDSKKRLASSQAAQRSFEARIAAAAEQNTPPKKNTTGAVDSSTDNSQLVGSGEWETALASHYSKTFTGRGASGEAIGPYSMMVAHKTLPFGTLIEFKYKGKTAVASVQDRGPYTGGRVFDLGPGVVRTLGFSGVHNIDYRIISR